MLLIEFDQNKSFTLDPFADLTTVANSTNPSDLQSKLVLLTLAFPGSRSSGHHHRTRLRRYLKN
jgi:DNA excision repair protein ERCC-4